MLCEAGVKPPRNTVSHPSAVRPTNKRGDTVPPFLLSIYKRQPVVLTQPKAKIPAICVAISFASLVSGGGPRKLPELLSSPSLQPLKSAGTYRSRTAHHVLMYFTLVRKSSGLGCCISQFLPHSLVSSCRSLLVRVFALIDISVSSWCRKPMGENRQESIIIFHLLHASHRATRVNLDAIPTRTHP